MSDAFCMIPIYTSHLNLGFNMETRLEDPNKLLHGTGKLIRHIPIEKIADYRNERVEKLIKSAIDFAIDDVDKESQIVGTTISKITRTK